MMHECDRHKSQTHECRRIHCSNDDKPQQRPSLRPRQNSNGSNALCKLFQTFVQFLCRIHFTFIYLQSKELIFHFTILQQINSSAAHAHSSHYYLHDIIVFLLQQFASHHFPSCACLFIHEINSAKIHIWHKYMYAKGNVFSNSMNCTQAL